MNHTTVCFVKHPLMRFLRVPVGCFGRTTRQGIAGDTIGYLAFSISDLYSVTVHKLFNMWLTDLVK